MKNGDMKRLDKLSPRMLLSPRPQETPGGKLEHRAGLASGHDDYWNPRGLGMSSASSRIACRRFTRLTNGFSKKLDNHAAAVSLYIAHCNLCRVHQSLCSTPAVAQGIADKVWSIGELLDAALATQPIDPVVTAPDRRRAFTVIEGGKTKTRYPAFRPDTATRKATLPSSICRGCYPPTLDTGISIGGGHERRFDTGPRDEGRPQGVAKGQPGLTAISSCLLFGWGMARRYSLISASVSEVVNDRPQRVTVTALGYGQVGRGRHG